MPFLASETQKTYLAIKQPPLRPPPSVFGPVWTVLYGLMGYAAYRGVHYGMSPLSSVEHIRMAKHGATLYTIQLGLNLIWMPLFFTLRRPVDAVAGWCMAPYLGWLGFATYLSAGAGYLNNWDIKDKEVEKRD